MSSTTDSTVGNVRNTAGNLRGNAAGTTSGRHLRTHNAMQRITGTALLMAALAGLCATAAAAQSSRGVVARVPARGAAVPTPAPAALGGAWNMPEHSDLVERVIRRIVTQDRPGAIPMPGFTFRAIGKDATLAAVRAYLGRDVELPTSVYASVGDWINAKDVLAIPECAAADTTCVQQSTVWLAITKFERGDLPHELNVWYTISFTAKPHDVLITNRYSFYERWLRIGGIWKYDGFIRVKSG